MIEEQINSFDILSVKTGIEDIEQDRVKKCHPIFLDYTLGPIWHYEYPVFVFARPPREPKWYIGITDEFIKTTKDIDRKLQGRILEAIRYLANYPDKAKGDTIQPLQADFKGLWRYRIGDYRLIYQPDFGRKCVFLLSFLSRREAGLRISLFTSIKDLFRRNAR